VLGRFTNAIFEAGVRCGRALERDRRWFTNHDDNIQEVAGAHADNSAAFSRLHEYLTEKEATDMRLHDEAADGGVLLRTLSPADRERVAAVTVRRKQ
jgi:hypothetical protein